MNIIIGTKKISVPSASSCVSIVTAERDEKLQASDWTQLPDVPLTAEQKAAWVSYRQELRNYPDTVKDEVLQSFCQDKDFVINFPTPPQE